MKNRLFYLDLLRFYAISCVILLHCITGIITSPNLYGTASWNISNVLNSIARTGVPLFLMISGFLILSNEKTADIGSFYKKRLTRILLPLAVWSVIYYIPHFDFSNPISSLGNFFKQIITGGTEYHMWFIYTLAGIYLIAPFLKRMIDNLSNRALILLLFIVMLPTSIIPMINTVTPIYIHLFNPVVEGYAGFFILGYVLGKVEFPRIAKIFIYSCGAVGFLLCTVGNYLLSSNNEINLAFNGGYMLNHYLFAGAIFLAAKDIFCKYDISGGIKAGVTLLSDISFGVYWIHVLIISISSRLITAELSPIKYAALQFIFVFILSNVAAFLISRVKFIKKIFM